MTLLEVLYSTPGVTTVTPVPLSGKLYCDLFQQVQPLTLELEMGVRRTWESLHFILCHQKSTTYLKWSYKIFERVYDDMKLRHQNVQAFARYGAQIRMETVEMWQLALNSRWTAACHAVQKCN